MRLGRYDKAVKIEAREKLKRPNHPMQITNEIAIVKTLVKLASLPE
jgi:hypothetical protein